VINESGMKDLGVAYIILRLQILSSPKNIGTSQFILKKFLKDLTSFNYKFVSTLFYAVGKNKGKSSAQPKYSQMIDCLNYIANCTKHDIAH